MKTRLNASGLSDPGRVRENNEDRFHSDPERGIFFVIDGVGGHAAGDRAADCAHDLVRSRLERTTGAVEDRIREAITLANNDIFQSAQSNPDWNGMACVLTVAVLEGGLVTIGQVGDSRCYQIEAGEIRKLTHDHSPIGEREDRGEIDEYTAMRHPRRNEVFRDVGSAEHVPDDPDFIETTTVPFGPASALLLCSDGLSDLIASQQILAIVEAHAGNPDAAARALIDAANEAGGKDNVTVVVVEGSKFASAVRRRTAASRVESVQAAPKSPILRTPIAFALYGLALALAMLFILKPHWRDTEAGTKFGFGPLREPRTWRVTGDIGNALANSHPGDTVVVAPGTYPEQIRLRSGVNLISERPREAVLQTSGVAVTAEEVQNTRIEGFRIISDEGQPLTVGLHVNDSSIHAVDMEITGAQIAGIEILGASAGQFLANQVTGNGGAGIIVRDTAKPRLLQNVVTNNGRTGPSRPGIEVAGSAQPVLLGNTLGGNAGEAIWAPQLSRESILRENYILPQPRPKLPARPVK